MSQGRAPKVSVVLPTRNRAAALRVTLPDALLVQGIEELVIVNDASSDDTVAVVEAISDPRLKLVSHHRRRGAPGARNSGVSHSTGDWILFLEDDCRVPADYARILLEEAIAHDADIVGAPWLNAPGLSDDDAKMRTTVTGAGSGPSAHPSAFPASTIVTPFIPALALVRRDVFDAVRFDEGYRGNGYREETGFFVAAARAGFKCILTPRTMSLQAGYWEGGQKMPTLLYEWWTVRNNWRFLRVHGPWLRSRGYIRTALGAQLAFSWTRLKNLRLPSRLHERCRPRDKR
jgi:glycosyltransferase involved in cell wall biosynthesis